MSAPATFSNVVVSTAFDSDAATSRISLAWILDAGLHTSNSRATGLVTLPYDGGVISMTMHILVASSLSHDLVLGMDWYEFMHAAAPQIIFHLSSGPLDLRHPLPSRLGPISVPVTSTDSSTVPPLFQGDTGGSISASLSSAPRSSTPRTRGAGAVPACTHVVTPIRGVPDLNEHDDITFNDEMISSPLNDPFVRLAESEQNIVVRFLVV
ncbi:hypothetical protein B0H17DRAFT_1093318, partial [Mycena rosella]